MQPLKLNNRVAWEAKDKIYKVVRRWRPEASGGFSWRNDIRSTRLWAIAGPNVAPQDSNRTYLSREGIRFNPREHSVTLEDFLFHWEFGTFMHFTTRLNFTTRQVNSKFFRREFWPRCNGEERSPSIFIKRYSRIDSRLELATGLRSIDRWAENQI